MSHFESRIEFYKELEILRGNPLIVYVTSSRIGALGAMAPDSLDELVGQLETIEGNPKEIDLLVESAGGDSLVAWRTISLLRSRTKKINVLIPNFAFSAATLLALGADKIYMGKYGCIGPIDPQIIIKKKDGSVERFAYEDVLSFLNFAEEEVGLSDQEHKEKIFSKLISKVHPLAFGFARRASSLSVEIGEKLLLTHMSQDSEKKTKARDIAIKLNKSFFSHGHALYRDGAKDIGLTVINPSKAEENLMWKIHKSFFEELKMKTDFDPLKEFMSDPNGRNYLQSPSNLNIPPQANQQVVQQVIATHLQNQLSQPGPSIEREVKYAFVESARKASEYYQKFAIMAARMLDLKFNASLVTIERGWRDLKISVEDKMESDTNKAKK